MSQEQTHQQCDAAKSYGLRVHLDGARLFNAAVALNAPPSALVQYVDSITLGITKGLGCPVGALVVGDKEFISEARHWRYVIGGAMCQAGCFAAAGLVALDTMIERLAEDHANAKRLAASFVDLGLKVAPAEIETNIVFVEIPRFFDGTRFVQLLHDHGVLVNPPKYDRIRFVTHFGVTKDDIDQAALQVSRILKSTSTGMGFGM